MVRVYVRLTVHMYTSRVYIHAYLCVLPVTRNTVHSTGTGSSTFIYKYIYYDLISFAHSHSSVLFSKNCDTGTVSHKTQVCLEPTKTKLTSGSKRYATLRYRVPVPHVHVLYIHVYLY